MCVEWRNFANLVTCKQAQIHNYVRIAMHGLKNACTCCQINIMNPIHLGTLFYTMKLNTYVVYPLNSSIYDYRMQTNYNTPINPLGPLTPGSPVSPFIPRPILQ